MQAIVISPLVVMVMASRIDRQFLALFLVVEERGKSAGSRTRLNTIAERAKWDRVRKPYSRWSKHYLWLLWRLLKEISTD